MLKAPFMLLLFVWPILVIVLDKVKVVYQNELCVSHVFENDWWQLYGVVMFL